ncbi:signal transduction histidine kinase/ActR/RegA family two-component response regulator [Massilia aurea]|uniref:histidine kinase n=1 Tax=Massilia aurea TaxID=373040 RepID=A0A7W9X313_9BURK|nr:ATP-binding protein [Massilia aurea]MBB6135501.1 signal transduction histidine kinase/ActR/RegA family two-component response regulator [Massilia aurea]
MSRQRSIRKKLVAMVMTTTLVALLVSIALVVAYDLRSYHRTLVNDLSTDAELVGHMTSAALTFDDPRLANEDLLLLRASPLVRGAAIYDARGQLFASYSAAGEKQPVPERLDQVEDSGNGIMVVSQPIVENGETVGTVVMRAENRMLARFIDYLAIAVGVTLIAMAIAYLLMRRFGRVLTSPIIAITEVARDVVATRDYSRRAPRIGDDEAAELADSFNAMLTEIEGRTRELEDSHNATLRTATERSHAQQEVMRLNEQLEQRVDERTLQLALANAELANANEEARSANQAKSAFLSSMSHELRTPLNAILGFAQILTSNTLPSTLEQKKEFANHILKSGRHLLTLINEILDLAKVESGTITLSMEPVALADILLECRTMIEPIAATRKVRVLFPDVDGAVVMADRTRLKQVMLNLLSNAVKYNRDEGAVVLTCDQCTPTRMRLSIQDTGNGLNPEQVASLFQPFNRLGQESGTQEGTGIGLVVTKRLVELMGGEIGVSSSPGVGSVFWIELASTAPRTSSLAERTAPAGDGSASSASDSEFVPRLLLYVEDNPANLRLVEEIVAFRRDLRLLSAHDGHLGLQLARAHRPDIILMDLNLPGMSGFEVLRQLGADPETADIPVIALTANAMPRDIERGVAAGFHRYLTKPIDIEKFTEAINSTLAEGPDLAASGERNHP